MRRSWIAIGAFLILVLITFGACSQDPLSNDFERADKLSERGHYEEAAEMFRGIATVNPHSEWAPKALFRSGTINYLYLKHYDDAVEDFAYLIYYYPKNDLAFDAEVDIIDIYMNKLSNYSQAIVELRKLIEAYPSHKHIDEFQYKLAQCFYYMRDFDQARLEYLILLDSYPRTDLRPQVYYDIASAYFVEGGGKLDKAIEYYSKLIDEYPDSKLVMEARFYSAAALEEKGELDEALKAYEELLPIYPNPRMVALRIEGVKNIIEKKASPAPAEDFMGVGGGTEGENTNGTEGEVKEVGGSEPADGIVIKTPDKTKETTPGGEKKDDTKK